MKAVVVLLADGLQRPGNAAALQPPLAEVLAQRHPLGIDRVLEAHDDLGARHEPCQLGRGRPLADQRLELRRALVDAKGLQSEAPRDEDARRARGRRRSEREERARDQERSAAGEAEPRGEVSAAVDGDEAGVVVLREAKAEGLGLIRPHARLHARAQLLLPRRPVESRQLERGRRLVVEREVACSHGHMLT